MVALDSGVLMQRLLNLQRLGEIAAVIKGRPVDVFLYLDRLDTYRVGGPDVQASSPQHTFSKQSQVVHHFEARIHKSDFTNHATSNLNCSGSSRHERREALNSRIRIQDRANSSRHSFSIQSCVASKSCNA